MITTLGVDEAGRGPAIGPLVLAAVVVDTQSARRLSRAGLRDSKAYGAGDKARSIRAELAKTARRLASAVAIEVVDVATVDRRVFRGELNVLEQEVARRLIRQLGKTDRIIADGKNLFRPLCSEFDNLRAVNHGESAHVAVAAASVIAKARRDEIFARIQTRYRGLFGDIRGGGYANAATREFITQHAKRFGCLPPEARRSWPHEYAKPYLASGRNEFVGADIATGSFGPHVAVDINI